MIDNNDNNYNDNTNNNNYNKNSRQWQQKSHLYCAHNCPYQPPPPTFHTHGSTYTLNTHTHLLTTDISGLKSSTKCDLTCADGKQCGGDPGHFSVWTVKSLTAPPVTPSIRLAFSDSTDLEVIRECKKWYSSVVECWL